MSPSSWGRCAGRSSKLQPASSALVSRPGCIVPTSSSATCSSAARPGLHNTRLASFLPSFLARLLPFVPPFASHAAAAAAVAGSLEKSERVHSLTTHIFPPVFSNSAYSRASATGRLGPRVGPLITSGREPKLKKESSSFRGGVSPHSRFDHAVPKNHRSGKSSTHSQTRNENSQSTQRQSSRRGGSN